MCTTYLSSHLPPISRQARRRRQGWSWGWRGWGGVAGPPQDKAPVCPKKFSGSTKFGLRAISGRQMTGEGKALRGEKLAAHHLPLFARNQKETCRSQTARYLGKKILWWCLVYLALARQRHASLYIQRSQSAKKRIFPKQPQREKICTCHDLMLASLPWKNSNLTTSQSLCGSMFVSFFSFFLFLLPWYDNSLAASLCVELAVPQWPTGVTTTYTYLASSGASNINAVAKQLSWWVDLDTQRNVPFWPNQ